MVSVAWDFDERMGSTWLCFSSRSPPPPDRVLTRGLVLTAPSGCAGSGLGMGFVASSWFAPGPPQRTVFGCFFGMRLLLVLVPDTNGRRDW
jgi:hypothetical protein